MTVFFGIAKIALMIMILRAARGLSVRALRELIKVGAIRTTTERRGPGRIRLCDATAVKRAAVIGSLNRSGFSHRFGAHRLRIAVPHGTL
jgi:hypothetical protein